MVVPHSLGLTRKTTTVQATAQSLPISALDLVPTRPGEAAGRAIARSVELARHVEQLGYKRYWVAEHHAIQGLACSKNSPRNETRKQSRQRVARRQPESILS